ncbi:MAG: hypothetical protein MUD12_07125 [Spirochaetes bacterium]|jgi:hypothetical protein|nr:hypothetical protein [Spirochaetota bacterium]
MKKLFILLLIASCTVLFAQDKKDTAGEPAKGEKTSSSIPDGYGSLKWGTTVSAARGGISGKIVDTDEKSRIVSRDGELEYLYGFFYVDPAVEAAIKGESRPEADKDKKTPDSSGQKADEGKLFYVALKFPYLAMEEVRKKLQDKYGPWTSDNLADSQGAIAWNGDKTIIVMWVDRYEKKPYCRRIVYVSKDIVKELNEYQNKVFNKTEQELIRKLNP